MCHVKDGQVVGTSVPITLRAQHLREFLMVSKLLCPVVSMILMDMLAPMFCVPDSFSTESGGSLRHVQQV